MKMSRKIVAGLLLAAFLGLGIGGCGPRDQEGVGNSDAPSQPVNITVATGSLPVDDWGYTAATPVQIKAPAGTDVTAEGHTLLLDASHAVVSGPTATTIISSSDVTTLPATAQSSAPGTFVSYLQIQVGGAVTAVPSLAASVDSALATGTAVTVYRYDGFTGKWTSPQSASVSSTGKIAFSAGVMGIYGLFK